MSQQDLANDCVIPKSQVARIEKAKVNTTVRTLIKIANALEIEPKELLDNNPCTFGVFAANNASGLQPSIPIISSFWVAVVARTMLPFAAAVFSTNWSSKKGSLVQDTANKTIATKPI
ncbi:helix-turn-helix domain-containing protein [Flavobacterium crassostreae]|nr:helix-turn-helix transcriptional regulator [Flavobacterium crassostreae]